MSQQPHPLGKKESFRDIRTLRQAVHGSRNWVLITNALWEHQPKNLTQKIIQNEYVLKVLIDKPAEITPGWLSGSLEKIILSEKNSNKNPKAK